MQGLQQRSLPIRPQHWAPPSHLTLELALLLEAEVFWGVSHHGKGLLGVVSAGQKKTELGSLWGKGRDLWASHRPLTLSWQLPLTRG